MSSNITPRLFIVVPCYNEEMVLPISIPVFQQTLSSLMENHEVALDSKIILVDDGSDDDTWKIIERASLQENSPILGIKFAHNRGHQPALYAGLMCAHDADADCCISLDADLQDSPSIVEKMLQAHTSGFEVVYAARDNRDTDSWFKRTSAGWFYSIMKKLGVELVPNSADFRLMGRASLEALSQYRERNLFLRGIVPHIGFSSTVVYYRREERAAGQSKYPLKKMVSFAFDGITSFSITPIRCIFAFSLLSLVISLALITYSLFQFVQGNVVPGWTSIILSIWLVNAMLMLSLGIIGEYIGKIYAETKKRPRFIVEKYCGNFPSPTDN